MLRNTDISALYRKEGVKKRFRFNKSGEGELLTRNVGLVVGDEMRDGRLRHLPDVVVPLLHPESRETERGLTSSAVLLRQVDGELVQDLARVALEGAEQRAVAVHHNESKSGKERLIFN